MILRDTTAQKLLKFCSQRNGLRVIIPIASQLVCAKFGELSILNKVNKQHPEHLVSELLPQESINKLDLKNILGVIRNQIPYVGHTNDTQVRILNIEAPDIKPHNMESTRDTVAIFTIDPIEQHAKHLPLGTDIEISLRTKRELLTWNSRLLSLTNLNYTTLKWALGIGASIAISETTLKNMLKRYTEFCLSRYHKLIIVSTHLAKDHVAVMNNLVSENKNQLLYLSPLSATTLYDLDAHAGVLETSLMQYLCRQKVFLKENPMYQENNILSPKEMAKLTKLPLKNYMAKVQESGWCGIVSEYKKTIASDFIDKNRAKLTALGTRLWKDVITNSKKEVEGFILA